MRTLTRNLSDTVEKLLANYIVADQAKRADKERRIDESIRLPTEHEQKYGLMGEEFSTL